MKYLSILIYLLFYSYSAQANESPFSFKNEYQDLVSKKYVLIPHKGSFLMPVSYNDRPNNAVYESALPVNLLAERGDFNKRTEVEFQISFLILTNKNIFDTKFDTFIGYTHHSWWQIYNTDWSRPFRETNYSPEIFFRRVVDRPIYFFGGHIIVYDIGLVHQSNGQIQELSRSWNRLFLRFVVAYRDLVIKSTLWYRIPEDDGLDDNPNITDFVGHGEIDFNYKRDKNRIRLKLIPGTHRIGYELSYSYPWKEGLRYYGKIGQGYGLSLIDFDHESRKIGLGIILADPFSK